MTDISIDDMIDARQQVQPGFRRAIPPEQAQRNKAAAKDAIGTTGYQAPSNTGPSAKPYLAPKAGPPAPEMKADQDTAPMSPQAPEQNADAAGKSKPQRPTGQAAADRFQSKHMFKSDEEGEESESEKEITEDEVDKGSQPVSSFMGREGVAEDEAIRDALDTDENGNVYMRDDLYDKFHEKNLKDPHIAIEAYRNKQKALERDASKDGFKEIDTEWARDHMPNITPEGRVMNEIGAERPYEKTVRGTRSDPELDDLTEEFDPMIGAWAAPGRGQRARDTIANIDDLIAKYQVRRLEEE